MKEIYEYEIEIKHKGKREIVQQSAFNLHDATERIKKKLPRSTVIKLKRKMKYPHLEGGRKAY